MCDAGVGPTTDTAVTMNEKFQKKKLNKLFMNNNLCHDHASATIVIFKFCWLIE